MREFIADDNGRDEQSISQEVDETLRDWVEQREAVEQKTLKNGLTVIIRVSTGLQSSTSVLFVSPHGDTKLRLYYFFGNDQQSEINELVESYASRKLKDWEE